MKTYSGTLNLVGIFPIRGNAQRNSWCMAAIRSVKIIPSTVSSGSSECLRTYSASNLYRSWQYWISERNLFSSFLNSVILAFSHLDLNMYGTKCEVILPSDYSFVCKLDPSNKFDSTLHTFSNSQTFHLSSIQCPFQGSSSSVGNVPLS